MVSIYTLISPCSVPYPSSIGSQLCSSILCLLNILIEFGTCFYSKVIAFSSFLILSMANAYPPGIPFLIRVGLALIYCCRRRILECTSEESLLNCLRHPSPQSLPPSPDGFISLVYSIKLKDDDVRKQRVKMEAQVKRQTQVRMNSMPGAISLPRT